LQFYLEHGLVLTKVHRAIRFKQARWLKPYVQANTDLRAKSNEPVETKLRKDVNNSIYGKTCENLTKRSDVKLVTSKETCGTQVASCCLPIPTHSCIRSSLTTCTPTAKRAQVVVVESDDDDADCADDSMRLVDEVAQFVALNGEF
jgi:hypothetical protein